MNKDKIVYVCEFCGEEFTKWSGMCSSCKKWNTLKEVKFHQKKIQNKAIKLKIQNLHDVKIMQNSRINTEIFEFDRVLGGGIVAGSIILLGGDPGIGKSTLVTQIAQVIPDCIYVSGEESPEQIKLRVERIGIDAKKIDIISETNVDDILHTLVKHKPKLVLIDSIQTMYTDEFPSTPGSLVQVRECALKMQKYSKTNKVPVILIGHVTKEGNIAGPKILEHLVDVVVYLEGDKYKNNRILKAYKNRFGSIDEIGVFSMQKDGFKQVSNPSSLFLQNYSDKVPGSVTTSTLEGNRPILLEIQALVTKSFYGYPKRASSGFDLNRLNLMLAILSKRAKIPLGKYDVYVNVVSGFKIKDPGVDLAVACAILSAYYNKSIPKKYCIFGEVGLTGEVRQVKFEQLRKKEAKRLGFETIDSKKIKYLSQIISKFYKK